MGVSLCRQYWQGSSDSLASVSLVVELRCATMPSSKSALEMTKKKKTVTKAKKKKSPTLTNLPPKLN